MFKKKKVKKVEEVEKIVKKSYPAVLDEIKFDVRIGVTHADNPENCGYLAGEKSMLEKVKQVLSK